VVNATIARPPALARHSDRNAADRAVRTWNDEGSHTSNVRPVADGSTGDDHLLARLVAGDDSALAIAYDRYGGFIYAVARRVTQDDATARDITQDVFVLLWQHPDRVDLARGTLRAYLGVVAHRKAVNEVRSAERRRTRERRSVVTEAEVGDPHAEHDDAAVGRWRAGRLRDFVLTLPPDQRTALELAYFQGCTYREVAQRLNIPEGTAKSRLRLALTRLRTMLDGQPLEAWR
jgi:RNA polymerase sigma-70 factor (ECF subfamily)